MIRFIKFCFLGLLLVQMTACVDQEFDIPPGKEVQEEDISNTTIAALKATHSIGDDGSPIAQGTIIKGTVISDDNAGSFFKELIIQDASGGVLIRVNRADLSTIYRKGKQVFVNCDGLNIGDFNGIVQIGYPAAGTDIDRIPDTEVETHIIEGAFLGEVTPMQIELSDINTSILSTLVEIQNVEFEDDLIGSTLAIPNGGGTQNRSIEDCDGGELTLRASDFADFAGAPIPSGNGTITGVLSVFGTTNQLTIRDVDDILMEGPRCDGSGGGGMVGGERVDIADLKALFAAGTTTGPEGFIEGIVISDVQAENTPIRNMVIQDETGGIIVRFSAAHSFPMGQKLKVATNGVELSEFNGGLQLNTNTGGVEDLGLGTLPDARVTTVEELQDNFEAWESTLVTIQMAEITGGASFVDANTISDASGDIATFVFSSATFSSDELPTGSLNVTGIVSEFNVQQIIIRNRNDVVGGTTGGGGGGGGTGDQISIADLRTAFAGGAGTAPDGFIEGVVISDYTTQSVTGRNLHIQDGDRGIVIRFTENHTIPLGAKLKVNVNGTELSEFNGLLQLNNVEMTQIESNTAGTLPTPVVVTVAEILGNIEAYESTLVMINDATISGGTTFSGALDVSDASGTIGMFTRNDATFAGTAVPTGTVSITAIGSEFNDPQITLRSADDVN